MNKINIVDEVQQNFLDSSLEVNMNRAFPDVRDGLKDFSYFSRIPIFNRIKNSFC